MLNLPLQMKKPQSAGSRGIKLNKHRPGRRYYDSVIAKLKHSQDNNQ